MINIPATTLGPNAAADFTITHLGDDADKPAVLAPAGAMDASWNGAIWTAWTESGEAGNYNPPQLPGMIGGPAPTVRLHVRVVNPTTSELNLAAQNFNVKML